MKNKILKNSTVLIIISLLLSSCSSTKQYNEMSMAAPAEAQAEPQSAVYTEHYSNDEIMTDSYFEEDMVVSEELMGDVPLAQREEKRIKDAYMTMETNDFENVINNIKIIAKDNGGYIENYNSYVYETRNEKDFKNGIIRIRISSDKYNDIINQVKGLGKVQSLNENDQNVTEQYYDIEARMEIKKAYEEKLLEMIGKAEKIEDLIILEQNLSETREVIEIYQSQLKSIDSKATFSSISIDITEVSYEIINSISDDFSTQIKNSFNKSINITIRFFENILIFIVGAIVPLIIVAISALVIFVLIRKRKKRKTQKNIKEEEGNDLK